MSARAWQRVRRWVQAVALALFVALMVYANAQRPQRFFPDLFSRLDPLLMISASLAGRVLLGGLILAALVLLLTLLFGRVWCGWLCPLGTLLEWSSPRRPRHRAPSENLRRIKVLLLLASLATALLGLPLLAVLDPITLLNRALITAVWPALRHGIIGVEDFLYGFPALWGVLDVVHGAVVQPLFQEVQPAFGLAWLMGLTLVGLMLLNHWAPRFWCRYLCPLGGLLGLISRLALVRREVGDTCTQCGRCAHSCPTGTIDPEAGYRSDPAECIVCLDCLVDCPQSGISFRWQVPGWRPQPGHDYDPSRRQALAVVGASVVGVALAGVEPIVQRQPATMIRPPGASTADFTALCVRCGACLRACPTQGLQPSLFEGGLQNLFTPRLVPRLGFCNFGCHACGQVCPTGAIPRLPLEEKQSTVLGLARVDRNRCLPWAYDIPCIVCEEACPVATKAIVLEEVRVPGLETPLQRPRVVKERCIGCGVCEYQCPMGGEAAIRVFAPTQATLRWTD